MYINPGKQIRSLDIIIRLVIILFMEPNLAIDSNLLEYALKIGGIKAENEIINLALEEFIKRRMEENVISVFNTVEYDENYDYKKLRGKR
jgi:hypothetical protein